MEMCRAQEIHKPIFPILTAHDNHQTQSRSHESGDSHTHPRSSSIHYHQLHQSHSQGTTMMAMVNRRNLRAAKDKTALEGSVGLG